MKVELYEKASEIIRKIKVLSDRMDMMEKKPGYISYFTDTPTVATSPGIFLDGMQARHKVEVMEACRIRKAELEKELADL